MLLGVDNWSKPKEIRYTLFTQRDIKRRACGSLGRKYSGAIGAGKRNRTPDLLITNELLYRLSYSGLSRIITFDCRYLLHRLSVVAGDARYFIFAPQDHAHALV